MTGRTHSALGILTSLVLIHQTQLDSYTITTAVTIGSLLPYIDSQKITLSKMVLPLSKLVDSVTKHRGFTHTILPFLLSGIGFGFGVDWLWLMGIGAFTHTILDFVTRKVGITCNSKGETVLYWLFWISNLALSGYIVYNSCFVGL